MDNKIIRASLGVTIIIFAEKLLGFLRDIIQAYYFGTGSSIDCIVSANLMISVFFGWLTTISIAFTPIYKRKKLSNEGNGYTDSIVTMCFLLSVAALFLCLLLRRQLIRFALPGFGDEKRRIAIECISILAFSLLFMGVSQINNAYLAANGRYTFSVISNLSINMVQILALSLSRGESIKTVAWGIVVAYCVQWVVSGFFIIKTGYRFNPVFPDKEGMKETLAILIPITLTHIVDDICTFFDKLFASFLNDGAISSLAYANSLRKVIFSFVTILITTIVYPHVAECIADNNISEAQKKVTDCMKAILLLLTPLIVCCILCSDTIVSIIFQHGAFNKDSTALTSKSFFAYLIGLVPLSINAVMTKYFYARKQAKYCTILSIITVSINILLDWILVKPLGHMGLAFGTSFSVSVTMPIYLILFFRQKDVDNSGGKELLKIFVSLFLSSAVLVLLYQGFSTVISRFGFFVSVMMVGLLFAAGFSVMTISAVLMREKVITGFVSALKKK
ncbi:MAG: murein biosynthesis integral membrane protein MurJ [Spirochaetales bacterium]|nr:murein biosynthesis integral membrane protein MurJ [Spirochaetales bacterium]